MHHHPTSAAPSRRARALSLLALIGAAALALAGCTGTPPLTGEDHPELPLTHVHGIVEDPASDGFLLGTHEGIFTVTRNGELGARLANTDFDAMGLTTVDDNLVVSGHPGRSTPPELGSPHLGIIRSSDNGQTLQPTAYTGEKTSTPSPQAQMERFMVWPQTPTTCSPARIAASRGSPPGHPSTPCHWRSTPWAE